MNYFISTGLIYILFFFLAASSKTKKKMEDKDTFFICIFKSNKT